MALDNTLCCLCLKSFEILLDIFQEQSENKSLAAIISQHFWVDIKQEENISKTICVDCWSKVDDFHTFYTNVYRIHNEFYSRVHDKLISSTVNADPLQINSPNKLEKPITIDDTNQNEVGKFETLIVHEIHEFCNVKIEEASLEDIDGSKIQDSGLKQKNQKPSEIVQFVGSIICESANEIIHKSHHHLDESSIKNIDDTTNGCDSHLSVTKPEEKKSQSRENYSLLETKIIEVKPAFESEKEISLEVLSEDENFGGNDEESNDTCNSKLKEPCVDTIDGSSKILSVKSAKKSKVKTPRKKYNRRLIDKTKIAKEDVLIRELFKMECDLCTFSFDTLIDCQCHYRKAHKKKGYLKCCDTAFNSRPAVLEHIRRHESPDEFKCDKCNKVFLRKKSLNEHSLRHLDLEDKPFICTICPRAFVRKYLYRRHMQTHGENIDEINNTLDESGDRESSDEDMKKRKSQFYPQIDPELLPKITEENAQIREQFKMQCELCLQPFDTFNDAKYHYRQKHRKTGYLRCCNVKFERRVNILEHIRRHKSPDEFKCDECGKLCLSKNRLMDHKVKLHLSAEERPYKCSECPKGFLKKINLAIHMETHKNLPKCVCDQCGKEYGNKILLSIHKKNYHDNTNVHICEVCAKNFRTKNEFDKHYKCMHEENAKVQCKVCGKWLKTILYLKRHMGRHQDTQSMLSCTECGKKFPYRKILYNHMRQVHPKEMFNCHLCDKQFKTRISLREHLANHTGFALYKCPHCPKAFSIRATMYSHRKKMHKAEWEKHLKLKAAGLI